MAQTSFFGNILQDVVVSVGIGAFLFSIFIWLASVVFIIGGAILWVFMIVDIVKRKNWKDENEKIIWLLIVILLGSIAAVVYYFVIKRPYDKLAQKQPTTAIPSNKTNNRHA